MASRTAARRPNAGAPGFKALITAVSLAATLGGWAIIARGAQKPGQQANNGLPPLSTLVPTPGRFTAAPTTRGSANRSATGGAQNTTGGGANLSSGAQPSLLSVTIAPNAIQAPVAITRSSR